MIVGCGIGEAMIKLPRQLYVCASSKTVMPIWAPPFIRKWRLSKKRLKVRNDGKFTIKMKGKLWEVYWENETAGSKRGNKEITSLWW